MGIKHGNKKSLDTVSFKTEYTLGIKLGDGAWGTVYKCKRKSDNKEFAVKIMKLENSTQIKTELFYLQELHGHKYFTQLTDHYQDNTHAYIVMELCNNSDLYDFIANGNIKHEKQCKKLFYHIVEATHLLHKLGIVHRDLKPENVLCYKNGNIKICDFGLSFKINTKINENKGTPLYKAPEILRCEYYNFKIDWWSCGIILYALLCGVLPFPVEKKSDPTHIRIVRNQQKKCILSGEYYTVGKYKKISDDAKDLISHLLNINPSERYGYEDIIKHPWMDDNN